MVMPSGNSGFCGRYFIFALFALITSPSSVSMIPEIIFNKVDFPVPLTPITPIFSLSFIEKSVLVNSTLSVIAFEKFFIVSKFIIVLPISNLFSQLFATYFRSLFLQLIFITCFLSFFHNLFS